MLRERFYGSLPAATMRLNRMLGDSQMTRSSNSPFVAVLGVGVWLTNTRLPFRLAASSAPVPPYPPFFPVEFLNRPVNRAPTGGVGAQLAARKVLRQLACCHHAVEQDVGG